jgi:pimeloyl-ACP methyl ester carboxylesterase
VAPGPTGDYRVRQGETPDFLHTCEVAFTNRARPFVLPGAGHFLQWERVDLLNPLVAAFFGDLRVTHAQ